MDDKGMDMVGTAMGLTAWRMLRERLWIAVENAEVAMVVLPACETLC